MKAWPNDEQRSDQGQHQASSYLIEVRDSTTTTWKTKKNMVANEWKNWVRLFCFLPNMANSLIFIKNSLFISYFCCSGHYYKTVGRLATYRSVPTVQSTVATKRKKRRDGSSISNLFRYPFSTTKLTTTPTADIQYDYLTTYFIFVHSIIDPVL